MKRAGRFTVTQWFAFVVGLLTLVAALGLIAGLLALARLSDRRDTLTDQLDPANVAALRLSSALLNEETGVRGYALSGDETFLEPYRRGLADEREALRALDQLQAKPLLTGARDDLVELRRRIEAWRSGYADVAVDAVEAGREPPPAASGKQDFDSVRAAFLSLQDDLQRARDTARDDLDRTATLVTVIFGGVGVLILLAVLAAGLVLRTVVITPLSRLAGDVREVAHGDFEHEVQAVGPREIAALGEDVNAMRGQIVAEVSALRDAERTLLEQARELQRSNQELEQFAYVASHDLQEPLRKVASFTQMLERRYKGQLDERADRYIAFAVDGAKRMQELINDLLEFSRVGRLTAPHERVDTGALVATAKTRLAAALEESGGEVIADEMPAVTGDEGLLTVVFQNLIANAIKFRGDDPPRVRFEAERDGRFWRFTCTDAGIGVEDEYAERIFVIFQRLHTRDAYEGTGIGLAMCRKIVEYHGGRIWLAPAERGSRGPLHLHASGRRLRGGAHNMSMPEHVEVIDVLLVEDDPGDVLLIEEAFADNKVRNRLHTVSDGVEALAFLRQEGEYANSPQPDLVLLDLNLPRKDGREVLSEVKGDEALQHIPVVVLTTSKAEEDVLRSYKLHANAYVTKPVDFDRFIEVVRQIDEFFVTVVKLPSR